MAEKRDIGLKAIKSAREDRSRSKIGRVSGSTWLIGGAAVVLVVVVAWFLSNRTLSSAKEALLAKQRAAVTTVGAQWFPLRDRLEKITTKAAGPYEGDYVDPKATTWDFRDEPGIYLRLRIEDAREVESLREHARESVKDAFTGCLLRERRTSDAGAPKVPAGARNPLNGTMPEQPWNLRQAYRSTRVLSDAWANEVRKSDDEIRLRVFEDQYERAKNQEIPFTVDVVTRAKFFLLVLDEDVPEARDYADGGAITEDALQQVAHPARVSIVDLASGREMVRLRRTSSASFVVAGGNAVTDPGVRAAMRRQVNNCALAQDVWAAIAPAEPAESAPAPTP